MKKALLASTIISTLMITACSNNPHWGYQGAEAPEYWGRLAPEFITCDTGKNQTPINIAGAIKANLAPLVINFHANKQSVINNGHTIQVTAEGGSSIVVDGERFELKQLHFHTPSENHIDGQSFPMEVHFVHANEKGELLVLGMMFKQGRANEALMSTWQQLPIMINQTQTLDVPINLENLLPKNLSYYRFNGSLTTPPCTEGVRWIVLKEAVTASVEQIEKFDLLMGHHTNRPLNPLNARVILE